MLSISPANVDVTTAVPVAHDGLALSTYMPIRKNVSRRRTGPDAYFKTAQTITADDIPFTMKPGPVCPHPAFKQKFVHKAVITHRRGDVVTVVTGPIEPTVPHTTPATERGWKKWFGDVADIEVSAKKWGIERTAKRRDYFKGRRDKKEAEWEAKCKRALEKGKPLPERPSWREIPPDFMIYVRDEQFVAMVNSSRCAESTKKRMREFKHHGSIPVAGRVCAPFSESFEHADGTTAPAVRSWLGIVSLSLLNSALSRDVQYGYDKEIEYSASARGLQRLFALDQPYIVLDKCRRCAFIVDLDGWWESVDALRAHLRKLVPPHLMPNIITYRGRESDGLGVENPHLVWLLPPGSRVLSAFSVGSKKQVRLHAMIQSGIVSHLIELGADPGHTNVFKTKNPLTAAWSIETCDDYFATMDDWRAFLPTITPDAREMRRRAKIHKASRQSGAEVNLSMAIWNDGLAFRRLEIKAAQRRKDATFRQAIKRTATFVDWLYHPVDGVVTKRLVNEHGVTPAVRSVLRAQREFVGEMDMTPSAIGEFSNRGRDAERNKHNNLGSMATAEQRELQEKARKKDAGRQTRKGLEKLNLGLIAEEIQTRMSSGLPVVKSEAVKALVRAGTVSRSVAYAHFDFVLETVLDAARYQDSDLDTQSTQSDSQIESSPVIVSEAVSGDHDEPVTAENTVGTCRQAQNPANSNESDRPAHTLRDLRRWYSAHILLDSWMSAVAHWREAKRQLPADDEHDLVNDPTFQAMVVEKSPWWHHQRLH